MSTTTTSKLMHSVIAKEVALKDTLDQTEKELNTKIAEWNKADVENARASVKNSMNRVLETIPGYNEIKVIPVLRNALIDLSREAAQNSIKANKLAVLNALKSEAGLSFAIQVSNKTIVYKNARTEAADRGVLKFIPELRSYCLDLYHLIDCVNPDDYEVEAEDPGNLSMVEVRQLAAKTNTIFAGGHWYMPINHVALHFINVKLEAVDSNTDNPILVQIVDEVKNKLFTLQSELKFATTSTWERLEKVIPLTILAREILDTKLLELQADFGTDLVYKVIFDNIENANANDFKRAALNFIKVLNNYIDNFKAYDDLLKELSDNNDKLRRFKFSKPKNMADIKAKVEYEWRAKKVKFEQDFKDLLVKTAHLSKSENYWFAIGWLTKHIKRIRVYGPEELVTVYPYSSINYDVTTPKGYVNASGFKNFAASGTILLDTEVGICSPAFQLLTTLVIEGNQNRGHSGVTNNTKDVTLESKQINNLNAALYLANLGFECSTGRGTLDQKTDTIAPAAGSAEYDAFMEGYNS